MSVTSAQVAQAAGVSRATVSYVLNDAPGQKISSETRESVLRAARELGYRPNSVARSLRSGRGTNVLFPLPGMQRTHVVTRLVDACTRALTAAGLSLVTDFAVYDDLDEKLDAWVRLAPAAVIDLLIRHDDPVLPALRKQGVPVLSAALDDESSWESTSDAFARATRETQLRHLLDVGARRIAVVLPTRLPLDPRIERRLVRRLTTMAQRSGAELVVERCDLTSEQLLAMVSRWKGSTAPDAVAAYNDEYAIGVMTALLSTGRRVPEDVRVMGVDDAPLAAVVSPALTTIGADFDAYAESLAQTIAQAVLGKGGVLPLPTPQHHLIVRSSA